MSDLDFIYVILVFAVGFYCGQWYNKYTTEKYILSQLSDDERAQLDNLRDQLSKVDLNDEETVNKIIKNAEQRFNMLFMTHETVNNQHYFYHQTDNVFICQGSSVEEAAKNFAIVHANVHGCVVHDDGSKFYIVNGEIQSELKNV